ncbi:MAG: cell division protein FtsY, partial [Cyanobacteriota bacterium]
HMAKQSGYDCVIAAADTFRAAAVEQVKVWGGTQWCTGDCQSGAKYRSGGGSV